MVHDLPIILLSGMAADERLFESQLAAFPNLRVQPWVPPLPGESLRQYALRLAPAVDPGRPCLVGGASFGGVVALELATHVPAIGCILIGSLRSPSGLPLRWRLLRPLAMFGPNAIKTLAGMTVRLGRSFLSTGIRRWLQRLSSPNAEFERWAICAVLRWRPSRAVRKVRVFQIHGDADKVLPVRRTAAEVIVPNGEHALAMSSPSAVNAFIASVLQKLE